MAKIVNTYDVPRLYSQNDGRFRYEAVKENVLGLKNICGEIVVYPPGSSGASHKHIGTEHLFYITEGRGTVSEFATRGVVAAHAHEPLVEALRRLDQDACRVMPVMSGGALVGLLTPENIAEFLTVHSAGTRSVAQPEDPPWQL